MNTQAHEFDIKDLYRIFPGNVSDNMSHELFISRLKYGENLSFMKDPCRFDGYIAYYCIKGRFSLEINLRTVDVHEGSFLVYIPGSIVNFTDINQMKDSECVLVAASRQTISSMNFDFVRLYEDTLKVMENPCISLDVEERRICTNYYLLAKSLLASDRPFLKDSILSLGVSMFSYLGNVWKNKVSRANVIPSGTVRSKLIFENFMKLVREYHNEQHSVAFYAGQLCLTPKYLSQLVHRMSGKTAPEWIDSFIIMEAKNYLKYSDMDIKAIVYKLNFRSQPVFYRFFKAHTGLTPAQYRKK